MGFAADRIAHIREGAQFLGNGEPVHIDQVGEAIQCPTTPFRVVPGISEPLCALKHENCGSSEQSLVGH